MEFINTQDTQANQQMGGLGSAWVAGRLKVKTTPNLSLTNKEYYNI
jgi:hypothetical protein